MTEGLYFFAGIVVTTAWVWVAKELRDLSSAGPRKPMRLHNEPPGGGVMGMKTAGARLSPKEQKLAHRPAASGSSKRRGKR